MRRVTYLTKSNLSVSDSLRAILCLSVCLRVSACVCVFVHRSVFLYCHCTTTSTIQTDRQTDRQRVGGSMRETSGAVNEALTDECCLLYAMID